MPDPILWHTADLLAATSANRLQGPETATFRQVGIDSRTMGEGDLFIAICGDRHDGHQFIPQVVAAGCTGLVVETGTWQDGQMAGSLPANVSVFGVPDTRKAMADLAAYRRMTSGIQVVAVTGSNGKTTTKEMLGRIFSASAPTLVTAGNYNNEIGLPLTLFCLSEKEKQAVLELGMNHPGEMARLSAIARPDIALITRIAPAHLEGLGSVEGVAKAKGEIFSAMKEGGMALLNGDDPHTEKIPVPEGIRTYRFGKTPGNDFQMEKLYTDATSCSFVLQTKFDGTSRVIPITLQVPGAMMAENALAAAAAALLAGLPEAAITKGLAGFSGFSGRFSVRPLDSGITVIDDTYNANPASMAAALEQTEGISGSARRFAVLGTMGELGEAAASLHREIGQQVAKTGFTALFCTGDHGEDLAQGARSAGLTDIVTGEKAALAAALSARVRKGDWVLVKGSRSMTMETIVHHLMELSIP